ncbi:hypothetical protein FOMPIDRAFT_1055702 [Fomitopsis schrenkii]|uniref:BTB domain-containing protein n=1 Tax=Fomitopsis schrenkii TaxID=2126942 RepID=S8DJN0_FOMSC|nr:hypothetical protein FOMPIDRAFT_1055702 [Fomitopsis schrenkii]
MDIDSSNSNTACAEVHDAPAPFNKPTADVILRTSDRWDFRVRRAILSEASPVFEGMFDMPQPTPSADNTADFKDGLPIVALQEDRRTLYRLLSVCYPVPNAPLDTIEALLPVLEAPFKYLMEGVTLVVREDLRRLAKRYPLRVYCLAIQYSFLQIAEEAARATLDFPRRDIYSSIPSVPELTRVDGKTPLYLLYYHQSCSDALSTLKHSIPFLTIDWVWFHCRTCTQADYRMRLANGTWEYPMKWWADYLDDILEVLRETPSSEAVKQENARCLEKAIRGAAGCATCQQHAAVHMHCFTERLWPLIDIEVSKVKLAYFLSRDVKLAAAHAGRLE